MKKNMSNLDRILRAVVTLVLLVAYFTDMLSGIWTTIGLVVIAAFSITSAIGFCPLYTVFGLKTKKD